MEDQVELVCSICNFPIRLEDDRYTDERGKPVHEDCYARKVTASIAQD